MSEVHSDNDIQGPAAEAVAASSGWRRGVRLCLDWGKARIGVAACDADGVLSYPVETVANGPGTMKRLKALVAEYEPMEIIMGMPTDLRGRQGIAASAMLENAHRVVRAVGQPVRLVDERLTTAAAARRLAAAGRDSRHRRSVIDQAAAVAILEQAVEIEKRSGLPAGELVVPRTEEDHGGRTETGS